MHSLIIVAHPSRKGFSHAMAAAYADAKRAQGDTVEIVDLYAPENAQGFLAYEDQKMMPQDAVREKMQKKMKEADEYVFCFPLWWSEMPAILKNWLDMNLTSGFAFQFVSGKPMPIGLLKGKTARIFVTADGPGFFYHLLYPGFLATLKKSLVWCGIKIVSLDLLGSKRKRTEAELDAFLAKVVTRA